jgi:hypothetical protein
MKRGLFRRNMKNIILWNYERGTWPYDIFCLLIVAFIFLTPKTWFDKKEPLATQTAVSTVKPGEISAELRVLK